MTRKPAAALARQTTGRCFSGLLWLVAVLCLWAAPAQAATYAFKTGSFIWESASNVIAWDRSCTSYPDDDDKATVNFTGGFTFSLGGVAYSSVQVLSNGVLQFVGGDNGFHRSYTNTTLPAGRPATRSGCASAAPTAALMVYWTDLDPSTAGNVTWQQKGIAPNRYVVVSWNAVYQYGTSTPYSFQAVLHENGEFKYQYGNSNASGSNATIGVQLSATDYTLYSYKSGYNANGSAIRWFQPSGEPARLAEFRFDEYSYSGAVGEVKDSSGNDYGGVRVGSAASFASGWVCRGLQIPANTSSTVAAVDTGVDVDTAIGNNGTISFWYQGASAWGSGNDLQLLDATTASGRSFHLVRRSSGMLRFVVSDSAGKTLVADSVAQSFAAGTWVHLAVTWHLTAGNNQSVLRIYVNGLLLGTDIDTTNGSLDPSLGSLFVGDNRAGITSNNATVNSANGVFDELRLYNFEVSVADIALDRTQTHPCAPPLDHLEIRHATGTGLTCAAASVTLVACQDAACTTQYTGGVTGTLAANGTGMTMNWPQGASFTIPQGSGSVAWSLQQTTAGSTLLSTSGVTPTASNPTTCNFGSPQCTFTSAASGLVFDVPDHVAETGQAITVRALSQSPTNNGCSAAFASVNRSLTFKCSYSNPTTGTLPVRVGGTALNGTASSTAACDAGGRTLSLAFNANGVASTTLQYADVGQLLLSASYTGSNTTGDAGLNMTGSDSFIAAPAAFAFSAITAAPIKAGASFSATVRALNSANPPATTPNFGREALAEGATLAFIRRQPSGSGASDGIFVGHLGAFSSGSVTATDLAWSEVGTGDLSATLASGSYLASGFTASGSTGSAGAVGRFIPHHFDTVVTPACSSFSYAGQPFSSTVTARNADNATTVNYDGSTATSPHFAKAVTLSQATVLGVGSLSGHTLAASAFSAGVASATPSYAFTTKQTAPRTLVLRAIDSDAVSSLGYSEGSSLLRSGRLRLANAFGSAGAALQLPVVAEYWSGNSWMLNNADSCSTVAAASVVLSNLRNAAGYASSVATSASAIGLVSGSGLLTLAAPSPAGSSLSLDLAINLGSSNADQSCLASHPASTGAAKPWLRAQNGACAATADRDPAARASFGIFSPESRKTVHVREIF